MIHQIEPELCKAKPDPKPCFTKSNNKGGSWIIDPWSMIHQIDPELCKAKPDRILAFPNHK
ncbi:MAG: hypothetical protein IJW10_05390 [Clostridia bacterium]|nr:hypothetical protein [Clostridia bacterium]